MSEEDKKVTQSVNESPETGNSKKSTEESPETVADENQEGIVDQSPGDKKPEIVADDNSAADSKEANSDEERVDSSASEALTADAVADVKQESGLEDTLKPTTEVGGDVEKEITGETAEQKIPDAATQEPSHVDTEEKSKDVVESNAEAVESTTAVANDEASSDESHDEDSSDGEDETPDFSEYSKKQLVQELKEVLKQENLIKQEGKASELKGIYEEHYHKEKEAALELFIADGGVADDFAYRGDDLDKEFFTLAHDFKERRSKQFREIERTKERNAVAKNQVLDKLRELVDSEETTSSIDGVKAIQVEWKSIGPVPGNQNKNLWASFNALMDRYYDNRSIYFELKELDRKKNLEHKLELCEKAEALVELEDLKEAIKSLNDLHEEFKHLGPVPREEQEKVWQRFKSASDKVYSRRKDYYEEQKVALKGNLDLKLALIEKLEPFKEFRAERIKDWNAKTKEMLAIQKEWETIGPVPRENGREINRTFWGLFKQFFNHKNHFFKELDEVRKVNKDKAEALIAEAEKLKDSTDWKTTANDLIGLQKEWKDLGPMPEKIRDDLYHRFKAACDSFFQSRRSNNKEANQEFDDNLKQKEAICKKIVTEAKAGEDLSTDTLEDYIKAYNEIGFVPRKSIKDIAAKFSAAVDEYVAQLGVDGQDKEEFLFRLNLNKIQTDPNGARVLNKKEHGIRKQIADLENNITLWKNNLEFFAASKTADKLKDQFDEKIDKAEQEVDRLKKKLSIIREF